MKNSMMKTLRKIALAVLLTSATFAAHAQNPIKIKSSETRHGPENGALVIIGGGGVTPEIWDKILELAGGKEHAKFVVVTNAAGPGINNRSGSARALREFVGEENVGILDLKTIREANDEKNLEKLRQATGVFFDGGRQWRIADAYLNTLAHEEFQKVLERGGVIAGSSAGASIQGSFLWRGDTKTPDILVGDHTQGLGFLKNSVIDQHILARNRQFDLIEFVKGAPQLIGIGLDESTAVVVVRDELEVVGKSIATIHSYPNIISEKTETAVSPQPENPNPAEPAAGFPSGPRVRYSNGSADAYKPFLVLKSGQKYDLKERKVIPPPRREFPRGFVPGATPVAANPTSPVEPAANPNENRPRRRPSATPENPAAAAPASANTEKTEPAKTSEPKKPVAEPDKPASAEPKPKEEKPAENVSEKKSDEKPSDEKPANAPEQK
ncbi:MAG: Type 1 glutamine amidotransferase-like domain-containing protein [Planctomycetaceae bacterium]|jgi:cyanophycinase|nr:Type 1 glutamine amidotransferase-like domain-containing protein [Planctomycetaceae bacterium]